MQERSQVPTYRWLQLPRNFNTPLISLSHLRVSGFSLAVLPVCEILTRVAPVEASCELYSESFVTRFMRNVSLLRDQQAVASNLVMWSSIIETVSNELRHVSCF